MCGISVSCDKDKFKELILANQSRGSFSHSFMEVIYNETGFGISVLHRKFGEFDFNYLDSTLNYENTIFIGHNQAPTGGLIKDINRIHPSELEFTFLYHNGIIQSKTLDEISAGLIDISTNWDTKLLHYHLYDDLLSNLNNINGSFACLYIDNKAQKIYVFRNSMCILYCDNQLNISSTPFSGSFELSSNRLFELDLMKKKLIPMSSFTGENNYFFG